VAKQLTRPGISVWDRIVGAWRGLREGFRKPFTYQGRYYYHRCQELEAALDKLAEVHVQELAAARATRLRVHYFEPATAEQLMTLWGAPL